MPKIEGATGEKRHFGREFEKVHLHFSEWTVLSYPLLQISAFDAYISDNSRFVHFLGCF